LSLSGIGSAGRWGRDRLPRLARDLHLLQQLLLGELLEQRRLAAQRCRPPVAFHSTIGRTDRRPRRIAFTFTATFHFSFAYLGERFQRRVVDDFDTGCE